MRAVRVEVMESSERARSPTSSWRAAMSGSDMARARDRRTLSAARDSRRIGSATAPFSSRLEASTAATAIMMKGIRARRWAATIRSTSPASTVSTPSTACTFWIGMETLTRRPPVSDMRTPATRSPVKAWATSARSCWWALASRRASTAKRDQGQRNSPGLAAGGKGRSTTLSAITSVSAIRRPLRSYSRARSERGMFNSSSTTRAASGSMDGIGSPLTAALTITCDTS